MQARRSLQPLFKYSTQRTVHHISRSRPVLHIRATNPSIQREQVPSLARRQTTMASATTFYDFKPLDSEFLPLDTATLGDNDADTIPKQ